MALESGTFVNDLVIANPTGGDPRSELDDHLRLVKTTLRNTFPEGSAAIYGLRSGTTTATTSGTSIDFTSIPSWVKRITVLFDSVSTNANSTVVVQLGDSGGVEATGYNTVSASIGATANVAALTTTSIPVQTTGSAAGTVSGALHIELLDAATNTWAYSGVIGSSVPNVLYVAGRKATSATLDRVRITTASGTDTFDAGSVNVLWE